MEPRLRRWMNRSLLSLAALLAVGVPVTMKTLRSSTESSSPRLPAEVTASANVDPVGYFDGADCDWLTGWTCDGDGFSQALEVEFFRLELNGSVPILGTMTSIGKTTASSPREPGVAANCGGISTHGFGMPTPANVKTGVTYAIFAYAKNIGGGVDTLLHPSYSRTILCAPPLGSSSSSSVPFVASSSSSAPPVSSSSSSLISSSSSSIPPASSSSAAPVCGNGVRSGTEECDDRNAADGDGCSANCAKETGWTCLENSTGLSSCSPVCNDGKRLGNEICDNGGGAGDGCDSSCYVEPGWKCSGSLGGASTCAQPVQCADGYDNDGNGMADTGSAMSGSLFGIFDTRSREFHLRYSLSPGAADAIVAITNAPATMNLKPIMGDWDGDGIQTPGLYDATSSTFYLRNSLVSGPSDLTFVYGWGGANLLPLVGDWNADGIDSIGLYDPATSYFHLHNTNAAGNADYTFGYGAAGGGWLPFAGDWDRNGVDGVGLYDPATSMLYLHNTHTTGYSDIAYGYGMPGYSWLPIAGDWNNDGIDTIGLYDNNATRLQLMYLRNTNTAGYADMQISYGYPGVVPVAGRWKKAPADPNCDSPTDTLEGLRCGNGAVDTGEGCDDHNMTPGDGCSPSCTVESGYICTGAPSVCALSCGNGAVDTGEGCDDHNVTPGDGCSPSCTVEPGYGCSGSPSACALLCGNGAVDTGEGCDDHNMTPGDGCSPSCTVESGYICTGAPSVCALSCGNGAVDTGEGCDDHNVTPGDGCSPSCTVEPGYGCSGSPSACALLCGNNFIDAGETCDDHNHTSGDGCSPSCQLECGDGTQDVDDGDSMHYTEQCDDGNRVSSDGCSVTCRSECGNSVLDGNEQCDDGNRVSGDGCTSACRSECGDGSIDTTAPYTEQCDDRNQIDTDGCSHTCAQEDGWHCSGQTVSTCASTCGDGIRVGIEQCDDGKKCANGAACTTEAQCSDVVGSDKLCLPRSGDGCSAICKIEQGYTCRGQAPSTCVASCRDSIDNDGNNDADYRGVTVSARNDTVGLYDSGSLLSIIRNSNTAGTPHIQFTFGMAGAVPLAGDWDGNGSVTPGYFDSGTGRFHLRNSNTTGSSDYSFLWHSSSGHGLWPIVGDWTNSGRDSVGLFNPATKEFYLKNTTTDGATDTTMKFGGVGDIPLAGDWNGDGQDTVGLYNTKEGLFFLSKNNATGSEYIQFPFGSPGMAPVVGDWNADGIDTVGYYNQSDAIFSLRNSNDVGAEDVRFAFGTAGKHLLPIAGRWEAFGSDFQCSGTEDLSEAPLPSSSSSSSLSPSSSSSSSSSSLSPSSSSSSSAVSSSCSGASCSSSSSSSAVAMMGDGIVNGDESCDDENTGDGDGCSSTGTIELGWECTNAWGRPTACEVESGDGVVTGDEECDDGNFIISDGCSYATIEPGWSCAGMPSHCAATCGNNTVDPGEECDEGRTNGTPESTCAADCSLRFCEDTDGDNVTTYGSVSTESIARVSDSCLVQESGGTRETNACIGTTCLIREQLCDGARATSKQVPCSGGCGSGACLSAPGNLSIIPGTPLPRVQQAITGATSDPALRLHFTAEQQDIRVTFIGLKVFAYEGTTLISDHPAIDDVELSITTPEGEEILAAADRETCHSDPRFTLCAELPDDALIVPVSTPVDVLARVRIHEESRAAEPKNFALQLPPESIVAWDVRSGSLLQENDKNGLAEGEVFIFPSKKSSSLSKPNSSIYGPAVYPVRSKIVSVEDANPEPDGTTLRAGDVMAAQFTFTAADNDSGAAATLSGLLFNVASTNVAIDSESIILSDVNRATELMACGAISKTGKSLTGTLSGSFLVLCDLRRVAPYGSIQPRENMTYGLSMTVENPRLNTAASSMLVLSLRQFNRTFLQSFGAQTSHFVWEDTADFSASTLYWIEHPTGIVESTRYILNP